MQLAQAGQHAVQAGGLGHGQTTGVQAVHHAGQAAQRGIPRHAKTGQQQLKRDQRAHMAEAGAVVVKTQRAAWGGGRGVVGA